jgi:hypothetical protein
LHVTNIQIVEYRYKQSKLGMNQIGENAKATYPSGKSAQIRFVLHRQIAFLWRLYPIASDHGTVGLEIVQCLLAVPKNCFFSSGATGHFDANFQIVT